MYFCCPCVALCVSMRLVILLIHEETQALVQTPVSGHADTTARIQPICSTSPYNTVTHWLRNRKQDSHTDNSAANQLALTSDPLAWLSGHSIAQ